MPLNENYLIFDSIFDWCLKIYTGKQIKEKCLKLGCSLKKLTILSCTEKEEIQEYFTSKRSKSAYLFSEDLPPSRDDRLNFKEGRRLESLPKLNQLKEAKEKAKLIHAFANHELLAIEMMARNYLMFGEFLCIEPEILKEYIGSMIEEQSHFQQYCQLLQFWDVQFGDFHMSSMFWNAFKKVKNINQYFSLMSLTFECANLDYAQFYSEFFDHLGDYKVSNVLKRVYLDELKHVSLGYKFLKKKSNSILIEHLTLNEDLELTPEEIWNVYLYHMTYLSPMTPGKSIGKNFNKKWRLEATIHPTFVENLIKYLKSHNDTHFGQVHRKIEKKVSVKTIW
jgi:uncharacterized ferritin-like protein (DUF455 family)